MNKPINLLADYKDEAGRYYHCVFKAYHAPDEKVAAASLIVSLNRKGFIPCAIVAVYGNYTMEELARIQNSPPVPGKTRILYIDKAEYQARSPG